MPYEISFESPEQKQAFDTWYAGIKSEYPDSQKRDGVVKEELEKRGLIARATYLAPAPKSSPPQQVRPSRAHRSGRKLAPGAMSSVILGIVGLFLCGPVLGFAAISEATAARKLIEQRPHRYSGAGLAAAGLAIGVLDFVGWILGMLLVFSNIGK